MGEEIEVIDPDGFLLTVRLDHISPERVEGDVVSERVHQPEPVAHITVAVANLPAPALELVLSRCTEVGAFAFHVVQAERSMARGAKTERWNTICREAAMLAGRLKVPRVEGPSTLDQVVSTAADAVLLVRGASTHLADLSEPRDLTLLVGPEGGWTDAEFAGAHAGGFREASLGKLILRTETAVVAALASINYALGE